MVRTDKNTKAKQKKAERKAMERKMNRGIANVKLANAQDDPLSQLPSFTKYTKNGLDIQLETIRAPELDEKMKEWAFKLLETNMKQLYNDCYAGTEDAWNDKVKRDELFDDNAWFLLAKTEEDVPVAFSHFRYDMDYDDEVVYCYEIQVEKKYRRKGLGRFMMKILELLAIKANMLKLMATIFKNDKPEIAFFKDSLKFETDETSPMDDVYEQFHYEIISRYNLIKKKQLDEEEANEENRPVN